MLNYLNTSCRKQYKRYGSHCICYRICMSAYLFKLSIQNGRSSIVNSKKTTAIISKITVAALAAAMFLLSSQAIEASGRLSFRFAEVILRTIDVLNPDSCADVHYVEHLLRKGTHFLLFFLLGYFSAVVTGSRASKRYVQWGAAMLFCFLFAAADEIHQLLVNRGAQISDVMLDCAGAATGISMAHLWLFFKEKHREK